MATNDSDDNEVLHMCLSMLGEECKPDNFLTALQTLLKVLRNIRENPGVEKFRTIRKENKSFHSKVWQWDSAQQFLLAIGWIDAEDCVILAEDGNVSGAITVLEQALSKCVPGIPAAPVSNTAQTQSSDKDRSIAEGRKKLMEKLKRDKEERQKLKEQIKADRRDVGTRESPKESKAKDLKFGAGMKKFKDIGVDLDGGGG